MRLSKSFTLSYFSTRLLKIEKIPISYSLLSKQLSINSVSKSKTQLTDKNTTPELDEEFLAKEEEIRKQQNKSKLSPPDFNKQNDRMPYEEPTWEYHETLKYKRRLYGKFGEITKVNPSILWPSHEEMKAMKEYESVAQPYSFQELLEKAKEKTRLVEKQKEAERAAVLDKVKNVNKEILEFHKRVRQKNEEAQKVAERKNKMIEEVRKHFGYAISVNDQKFKDMLSEFEQKQIKELKAAKIEERAKKRQLFKEKKQKEAEASTVTEEKEEDKQ